MEDRNLIRMISTAFWVIWYNRNLVVHGKNALTINACSLKVNNARFQFDRKIMPGCSSLLNFNRDNTGAINFYSDGSWSGRTKTGGWATVAIYGNIILRCKVGFNSDSDSSVEEEIRGLVESLKMAKKMGCIKANFFSDNTDTIWAMQRGFGGSNKCVSLISKGLSLLKDNLGWNIYHVFREDNLISDFLAQKGRVALWKWESEYAILVISAEALNQLQDIASFESYDGQSLL